MDPEADPKETASLRHLSLTCAKQFQQLSKNEETVENSHKKQNKHESLSYDDTATDRFWASRLAVEFNLWCARIGVHAEGLRSIDVRLKDVPEICKLLLHLLQALHSDLNGWLSSHLRRYRPQG